jgi:flagellin
VHVTQNSLIFQVGPNCEQEEIFSLGSLRTNEMAQGVGNESDFRSLADIDLTTQQGASDAICLIDQAIDEINQCRADLGSFQKNSLETNSFLVNSSGKNLRVHNENLVSAESTIRDADMAAEMSDFTRNQILLASGTAMTAQANQIPRSVLQLISAQ